MITNIQTNLYLLLLSIQCTAKVSQLQIPQKHTYYTSFYLQLIASLHFQETETTHNT